MQLTLVNDIFDSILYIFKPTADKVRNAESQNNLERWPMV